MVPLTLPSHVSMLTSTYPFVSGVEDNGDRLAPGTVTLAGRFGLMATRQPHFLAVSCSTGALDWTRDSTPMTAPRHR
jgi:hypothetical protein